MAASRVGGYHVRPPTTWPGRTPTSRSGETHPPRGRLAVQARREPPRPPGDTLGTLSPQAGQPGKDP